MADFLAELNSISRSKEEIANFKQRCHDEKIIKSMLPEQNLLDDFNENFLENIQKVIKNKAYMGEYSEIEGNKKRITGEFTLVKKCIAEYIGVSNINGIRFDNGKVKMEVPFEANLLVSEPVTSKKIGFV